MAERVCWIDVIDEEDADAQLAAAYDALRRQDGTIHNLYRAFSRFPDPVVSADRFYRDVMHAPDAPLPMWLAELLSVDVAIINGCAYAATHHGANFVHLFGDEAKALSIVDALRRNDLGCSGIQEDVRALLAYGRKLSERPNEMSEQDIEDLRAHGWNDGQISQAVQVTASFAYWTRIINALGIQIGDEKVGKYG